MAFSSGLEKEYYYLVPFHLFGTLKQKYVWEMTFEKRRINWGDGNRVHFSNIRGYQKFYGFSDIWSHYGCSVLSSFMLLLLYFLIHPLMGAFSLFGLFMALLIGILIEKGAAMNKNLH